MRVLILVLLMSSVVVAQDLKILDTIVVPVLTEEQKSRLDGFALKAENISLKITLLQHDFAKLQADANIFATTLKKDGFTLKRNDDGSWGYIPEKP